MTRAEDAEQGLLLVILLMMNHIEKRRGRETAEIMAERARYRAESIWVNGRPRPPVIVGSEWNDLLRLHYDLIKVRKSTLDNLIRFQPVHVRFSAAGKDQP